MGYNIHWKEEAAKRAAKGTKKAMDEQQELDMITFVSEDGEEITMEVIDYFFYEGEQYAILTEYEECDHDHENCEHDHDHNVDAFIMKVVEVGEDEEEFVPVEDEALMEKLIAFVESDVEDDEDEEEDE